ncbi:MAG TPA: hypothetical protein VFS85_00905 [Dongiaceae bacterium]|jgi:hypothetical protein|nr:hypothetical protein [Dongiaceae bacterium]
MFHLMLTTCFAGLLCYGGQPNVGYVSAERCLEEGAILSGVARAHLDLDRVEQSSRIVCSSEDGAKATVYIGRAVTPPPQFPDDAARLPAID